MRRITKLVAAAAVTLSSLAAVPGAAQADPTDRALLACEAFKPHTGDVVVFWNDYPETEAAWDEIFNCTAVHTGVIHLYYVVVWWNGAVTWTPGFHYCELNGNPTTC